MGLGVLQPKAEHVPGTVYVYDDERREAELVQRDSQLKRDKTGKIILVPQPSDDPNDPLVRKSAQRLRSMPTADAATRTGRCGSAILSSVSSPLSR